MLPRQLCSCQSKEGLRSTTDGPGSRSVASILLPGALRGVLSQVSAVRAKFRSGPTLPPIFVNVVSKGLTSPLTSLKSTLTRNYASTDSKQVNCADMPEKWHVSPVRKSKDLGPRRTPESKNASRDAGAMTHRADCYLRPLVH